MLFNLFCSRLPGSFIYVQELRCSWNCTYGVFRVIVTYVALSVRANEFSLMGRCEMAVDFIYWQVFSFHYHFSRNRLSMVHLCEYLINEVWTLLIRCIPKCVSKRYRKPQIKYLSIIFIYPSVSILEFVSNSSELTFLAYTYNNFNCTIDGNPVERVQNIWDNNSWL